MRFGTKTMLAAGLAFAVGAASATGALAQLKPEETLKMRQGLMQAVKMQAGPMLGFAQGKNDLPGDAATRAEHLVALAKLAPSAWAKGSENIPGNNTKAPAYGSEKFAKGWEMLAEASLKLAEVARAGDPAIIKAAAGEVGKTCKGCHDDFKAE